MVTARVPPFCPALVGLSALCILASGTPARAELRISDLSVFLNDYDVTVNVVLLGAVPDTMHEALQSGLVSHVRLYVELWQQNRVFADRRVHARVVERQVSYNVLTKEYRVASVAGEQREPYLTKHLREAQRVVSQVRVHNLAPAASLNARELYYVRVRSEVTLGGVNSWFARFTGEAEETPWVQSDLLTTTPSH